MKREAPPRCTKCGKPCLRKTEGKDRWRKRKFCSRACSLVGTSRHVPMTITSPEFDKAANVAYFARWLGRIYGIEDHSAANEIYAALRNGGRCRDFTFAIASHGGTIHGAV